MTSYFSVFRVVIRRKVQTLLLFAIALIGASAVGSEDLSFELRFRDRVLEWFQLDNHPENVRISLYSGTREFHGFDYEGIGIDLTLPDPTNQSNLPCVVRIGLRRYQNRDDAAKDFSKSQLTPVQRLDFRDARGWGRLTGSADGGDMAGYWREFNVSAYYGINRPYELVGMERFGWAAGMADVLLYCLREAVEPGLAPKLAGSPGVLWKEPGEMGYMEGPFVNDPRITWRPFHDEGYAENFIAQGRAVKRVDMDLVQRLSGARPTWAWQKGWWIGAGLLILVILVLCYLKRALITNRGDTGSTA